MLITPSDNADLFTLYNPRLYMVQSNTPSIVVLDCVSSNVCTGKHDANACCNKVDAVKGCMQANLSAVVHFACTIQTFGELTLDHSVKGRDCQVPFVVLANNQKGS